MKLHKFRSNYWSNSNFAKWLYKKVDVTTMGAATSEEWDAWNDKTEKEHPIMYWFNETVLGNVQDIVQFPSDVFNTFQTWFKYSFIKHTPIINTRLKRGEFHGAEELILHGMFAVLVEFVECEKANMYLWSHSDEPRPWWMKFSITRWGKYRNVKHGFAYLEWEASLGEESPYQAEKAQQIMDLYNWWTITRPNRPDPFEASGLKEYYDKRDLEVVGKKKFRFGHWLNDTEKDNWKAMSDKQIEIEEAYEQEDTDMLIKLIEIRRGLWT